LSNILTEKGLAFEMNFLFKVAGLVKDRAVLIPDLWDQSHFFFIAPETYDEKIVQKFWKPEIPPILKQVSGSIIGIDDFSTEEIDHSLKAFIQENGLGMGQVMNTLRLVLVGGSFGPGVAAIISVLGKEETQSRIERALKTLGS
jgi:glutamyl-tRNA synthetase